MTVKKGDFIEVEYTGKVKEDNFVFDTTSEKVAKDNQIYDQNAQYGPAIICIGQHQLLKGLDDSFAGKEIGKEYTVDLQPENAFGKKSTQLLKLVPLTAFKKGNTRPEPGMQVDVDGNIGTVKTVSGGRVVVDFNHPLSGKEIIYTFKIMKIVTDDAEKIKSAISIVLNLRKDKIHVSVNNGKVTIKTLKLPESFQKELEKRLKDVIPGLKEFVFEEEKQENTAKQPLNTSKK